MTRSIRARFLSFVLAGVVIPLAIVGVWLARSAVRSGESMLASQLESSLAHVAGVVTQRWRDHESDVELLALNEPIQRALARPAGAADTLPSFVREAYAGMASLDYVVIRDFAKRIRWRLGATGTPLADEAEPDVQGEAPGPRPGTLLAPSLFLRRTVRDEADGRELGVVEATVRASTLMPGDDGARAPEQAVLALHDRTSGRWTAAAGPPAYLLESSHFTWNGQRWLVARRTLTRPSVDLFSAAPLDPVLRPFERAARTGDVALVIVGAIVLLVAAIVTSRMTASLEQLAVAADAVALGDLERSVAVTADDEVGRVGRAFNSMTESLRRMIAELSQREAVAAVGELAATIAHQVRSPVTAMKLDLQRAAEDLSAAGSPRRPRELVAQALAEVDRLERAVSASLRIARRGTGRFEPLDARAPLQIAMDAAAKQAEARGVSIDAGAANAMPLPVHGDEAALAQMFGNVINNAVEVARTSVTIRMAATNGALQVEIHDDGPGVSGDVVARMGQPFYSRKAGGTGLGLAIAKRVAAAHGGEISIRSSEGEGTTVKVVLSRAE